MANEMQRGNLTGTANMRMPISGTVSIGGNQMKELRFMPYSEFPEEGREDVLYIDTDGNAMYYWNGTEYIALSGGGSGGTSNYNELSNKPSINDITLTGNNTSSDLGLQPTISDIATIRSGAASGATAVQPSDMETALASKQDVIDDLSDIRTGAAAGETAVQPSTLETALSGKQDVISDISDIRSGAADGATALQPEDIDTLPTDGSSNPVSSGGTYNFVNSSIATNTAYFIGTFASVAELEAYSGTVTNNDYAFVTSTDSAGNTLYNRYKYNAATQTWSFEYAVNNTAFTAAQWAAIQSGMTASDKTKLDGIEQGANKTVIDATPTSGSSNVVSSGGVYTALSGKQDTIADLSDIRSGASAGATAVQPSALNDYQTKLSGTNKLDPSYIEYDATHRAVTDTEKSTWSGKQDEINDLSTIRSGSEAGATAVQTIQIDGTAQTKTNGVVNLPAYPTTLPASDVTSTYSASGTAPVNGTAVNAAIGTLDVSSVGGSGKYISAISETNGKIAATPTTFDTALSSSSTNSNAPTSKTVYDDQQRQDALEAEDRAALVELVDGGAKNLAEINNFTYTAGSSGGWKTIPINKKADEVLVLSIGTFTSTDTNATTCQVICMNMNTSTQVATLFIARGNNVSLQLPAFSSDITEIRIYPSSSYAASANDTLTATDLMICTAADWNVSQKFVPYRPSWQELYDMILALQNGGILNIVYGMGEEIPNNSDLDDYTTPGTFYVLNSTNAATIANKPAGGSGFRLIVSLTSAANRQRQEFYKPTTPDTIYIRNVGTDGNWSDWYQFNGTAVT